MSEFMIRPEAKSIGLSGYDGRKKQSLLAAAKHNLREIQKEIGADRHIKPERICLNEILAGPATAAEVEALAQAMRDGIGYMPKRRDFTQAHEMVFTLSSHTALNTRAFFDFCLAFVVAEFGQRSILSAVIHRDEEAPHLHVLLSPIAAGKYVGSALITKSSWAELVDKFALVAPKAFGVTVEKTLTGPIRKQVTRAVQDGLRSVLGPHISDDLLAVILKAAGRNPAPFKAAMGITVVPINDGGAEFRRIALSTGKGSKRERNCNPYGFEVGKSGDCPKPFGLETGSDDSEKTETIPCVVSPKTPTLPPPTSGIRQPAWHGIYCSHRVKPIGLFTSLIPGSGFHIDSDGVISGLRDQPGQSVAESPHIQEAAEQASSVDDPDFGSSLRCPDLAGETRLRDDALDAGAWDSDRGEFATAQHSTGKTPPPAARHTVDTNVQMHTKKRTEAYPRALAIELVSGDSHVERDDFYQPDFSESEVHSWLD
jgi:hypothetical protein